MRQKDKIEKYLDRLIKKHNGTLQESELSRYYSIRGTHKYKYDTYPDNDCFHEIIEYTVEIKKVTTITEYL